MTWPKYVFFGVSIFSLPLYFLVLICLLRLRRQNKIYCSTFYTILTQHCIVDIFYMIFYTLLWECRLYPGFHEFYFKYREYYISAATYTSVYYFLYIRCFGIILLTLNRLLSIRLTNNRLTEMVKECSKLRVILIYWMVPTFVSLMVLKDYDIRFNNFERMEPVPPMETIHRNALMASIVVISTCLICSTAYGAIFVHLRSIKKRVQMSRSYASEIRLTFQVFTLVCAFFFVFVYFCVQSYLSMTNNIESIFAIRVYFPLINGVLSYINPFCMLFFNTDFSKKFSTMFTWCAIVANRGEKSTKVISPVARPTMNHKTNNSN